MHLFGYQGAILPDAHCLPEGTTTVVDAGGSGHITFDEFNEKIIELTSEGSTHDDIWRLVTDH